MCLVYVVQALDKGTLGPASIMGWRQDVGAQGQDYAMTGTMLWVGVMCGEPFAAQLVRRFPIAKMLSCTMVTWTAVSTGHRTWLTISALFRSHVLVQHPRRLGHPIPLGLLRKHLWAVLARHHGPMVHQGRAAVRCRDVADDAGPCILDCKRPNALRNGAVRQDLGSLLPTG